MEKLGMVRFGCIMQMLSVSQAIAQEQTIDTENKVAEKVSPRRQTHERLWHIYQWEKEEMVSYVDQES